MTMLVASRALQGIGGGAIMVTAMAVIGEVIPLRDRGRYQGALGAVFGVTTVIGPLLGGFFTDHLTWRWAFWINVPVAVVVLLVGAAAIPPLARAAKPVIDYAGILFVGLGASGLTLATSWGGGEYAWASPMIIGLFVGSAVALAVFVWVESRAAEPILPIRLFASPVFTVCCVLGFIVGFAMLGALTFLPTFMQFVDGVSATDVGPAHAADGGGHAHHLDRQRRHRRPHRPVQDLPGRGHRDHGGGFVLLSRWTPPPRRGSSRVYLFILGTGIGLCMQVLILVVQNTASFADLGVATSGVTFFRTIGSSFGAAIFGSLFANFLAEPHRARAGGQRGAAARGRSRRRRCTHCRRRWRRRSSTPTPTRWERSSCARCPSRSSASSSRCSSRRCRCARWRRCRRPTSARASACRARESPEKILEMAVGRLFRDSPEIRLRNLAGQPGCELDVALLWALIQIYRQSQVFGSARLTDIAERLRVPPEVLEPTFDRLVECGLRAAHRRPAVAHPGRRGQVDCASAALVGRIVDKLAASPAFEGTPGPRAGRGRAGADRAPDAGAARLGRRRSLRPQRRLAAG